MSHLKVVGVCRLSRDPELRYTSSGTAVLDMSVVTNEKYKDKKSTSFNECVAWGKTAEIINEYFRKGDMIFIDGKLEQHTWETDGKKHSKHKVTVVAFDFCGGGEKRSPAPPPQSATNDPDMDSDDIPF